MQRMTRQQLADYLFGIQGSSFIGMTVETEPTMRKTGNPYAGRVRKINRVNGLVNFYYEEGVLRRLEKAGKSPDDYKKGESWHEPVLNAEGKLTPLCRHKTKGTEYLRFQLTKAETPTYLDQNDQEVPVEVLEPFMPEKRAYSNQGLDEGEELKILTYSLDSIRRISVKGEDIEVIG